jgi:hypothetical protein
MIGFYRICSLPDGDGRRLPTDDGASVGKTGIGGGSPDRSKSRKNEGSSGKRAYRGKARQDNADV